MMEDARNSLLLAIVKGGDGGKGNLRGVSETESHQNDVAPTVYSIDLSG